MPVKLKDFTHKFKQIFTDKKKTAILLAIGILGMIFIGLSDTVFIKKNDSKTESSYEVTVEEYIESMEKKTVKILSQIDGAGRSKIMITAESSKENDFAINQNKSEEISGDFDKSSETQTEIVMIENDGDESPLVTKTIEPEIRGVLVLCEGADNSFVKEKVTQAVKTVLGVSSNKICVLKLK